MISHFFNLKFFVIINFCKGAKAALTIDRGAEAPLYAALLPPRTEVACVYNQVTNHNDYLIIFQVRGAYIWHDCQLVDWVNGPYPPFT